MVSGLALVLAACSAPSAPSAPPPLLTDTPPAASTPAAQPASAQPLPTVAPTVGTSPTSEATPTVGTSPTLEATPTPEPTGFGSAVFADPDDCTNLDAGYRVAYPDWWYSNSAVEGIAACWLFAPTNFDLTYGTEIPAQVAIVIRRYDEWNSGSFSGRRVLTDQETVVDGIPTRVQEIETTERSLAFAPGDRFTEYVVGLEDGTYLVATTYLGPDYESAKSVLDDMMRTMHVGAP